MASRTVTDSGMTDRRMPPTGQHPRCCGEQMEHLGSGVWQCDPCGCLRTANDLRPCPDHT